MRAVQQCHLPVIRLLVSYGADLELVNSDRENVFHIMAKAASSSTSSSSPPFSQDQDQVQNDKFLELARWLKVKADSQLGRFQRMLLALDLQGHRPQEYLRNNGLRDILTPN